MRDSISKSNRWDGMSKRGMERFKIGIVVEGREIEEEGLRGRERERRGDVKNSDKYVAKIRWTQSQQ